MMDLPYGDRVALKVTDFRAIRELRSRYPLQPSYGIRLDRGTDLSSLYRDLETS
jgi:hypothetical protein